MASVQVQTYLGNSSFYRIDQIGNIFVDELEIEIPVRVAGSKKKPYRQVQLLIRGHLKWFYLHTVVIRSWRGPPTHPKRNICDHISGDSLDNSLWNLRYVTAKANMLNRKVRLYAEHGVYYPRVCGHVHYNYGTDCETTATVIRQLVVEKYILWTNRFPEKEHYPHTKICKAR
jgi:hypothetical protein